MSTLSTMSRITFKSKIPMYDGTVNIDGFDFPMDFVEYLPINTEFEYYCNYGMYVERGTFKLTNSDTILEFPISKLEFNPDVELVNLEILTDNPNAIISIYPAQLVDIIGDNIDISILPDIEIVNNIARVPETGMWIIMIYIPDHETVTKTVNTTGNDTEIYIPSGDEIKDKEEPVIPCTLSVIVSPITALVELLVDGLYITNDNNYFEGLDPKEYTIRVSESGYTTRVIQKTLKRGLNKVSVNLFKESGEVEDEPGERVNTDNNELPNISYNEVYINTRYISEEDTVADISVYENYYYPMIAPLTNVYDNPNISNTLLKTNYTLYSLSSFNPMKIKSGYYNEEANTGIFIAYIPCNLFNVYPVSIYVDMEQMRYKYFDLPVKQDSIYWSGDREPYNIKCNIKNHIECSSTFESYSIEYYNENISDFRTLVNTGSDKDYIGIDETYNTKIYGGIYTLVVSLKDFDGDIFRVPITPDGFMISGDLNISLNYTPHIKVKINPGLYDSKYDTHSVLLSSANPSNVLRSSIFEDYGYTDLETYISTLIPSSSIKKEIVAYVKSTNTIDFQYIVSNSQRTELDSYTIKKSNISHGSVIVINSSTLNSDMTTIPIPEDYEQIFRFTPFKFTNNNSTYYGGGIGIGINQSDFIDGSSITDANINLYERSHKIIDANYIMSSTYHLIKNSNSTDDNDYLPIIRHNSVQYRDPSNTVNLKISPNIPGVIIKVYDTRTPFYKMVGNMESYGAHPKIYESTNMMDVDILDNVMYSVTLYKRGYAIRSFSFCAYGEDIELEPEMYHLNEWRHSFPTPNNYEFGNDELTDIEFVIEKGATVDIKSIEPNYNSIEISGNKIIKVPKNIEYKISLLYTPPRNIKNFVPVDLVIGGAYNNPFRVGNKPVSIVINKITGTDNILSNISIYNNNSPILDNKKISITGSGSFSSYNLSELPKDVYVYGYSDDMTINLYDNDTLIRRSMFFISKEHSDIMIRVPSKPINKINIIPFTDIVERTFVVWKEQDPFVAPYYPDKNINKYTQYNKIEPHEIGQYQYIYGDIGNIVHFKICVDGYDEYEGTIAITSNTILDLNNFKSFLSINKSAVYYGIEGPNMEYMSISIHNQYLYNNGVQPSIYNNTQEGPVIKSIGSLGTAYLNKKYNIPLFDKNIDEFDIRYEEDADWRNSTTNSNNNGIIKAYYDNRTKYRLPVWKENENHPALHAYNIKYPFIATIGELAPRRISILDGYFPRLDTQVMSQNSKPAFMTYLYPGRYKYYTQTQYSETINNTYNMESTSGDRIYYSVGDILIKEGMNYIESNHINNIRIPIDKNDIRMYKIIISDNEYNQVQVYGEYWSGGIEIPPMINMREWALLGLKNSIPSLMGSSINKLKLTSINNKIPTADIPLDTTVADIYTDYINIPFPTSGKFDTPDVNVDRIMYLNFTEYMNISNAFGITCIDKTESVPLVDVSFNNKLFYKGEGYSSILYDSKINQSALMLFYNDIVDYNMRYPIARHIKYDDNLPVYYKLPHKNIIRILYDGIIRYNNVSYKAHMFVDSPVSYGVSYNPNSFNRTVVNVGEYATSTGKISGDFPINTPILMITYSDPTQTLFIKGTLNITKNKTIMSSDGVYDYNVSMNDITIDESSVEIIPLTVGYHAGIPILDGRVLTGEFVVEQYDITSGLGSFDVKSAKYGNNNLYKPVDIKTPRKTYDVVGGEEIGHKFITRVTNVYTGHSISNVFTILSPNVIAESRYGMTSYEYNNVYLHDELHNLYTTHKVHELSNIDNVFGNNIEYTSTISFTNIRDVDQIKISPFNMYKYYIKTGFVLNPNKSYKFIYGPYKITIFYKNKLVNERIININTPTTVIDLDETHTYETIVINTGGYKFTSSGSININDVYIELLGTFKYIGASGNNIPVGEYRYTARAADHIPIYGSLSITKGKTTTINLSFEKDNIIKMSTVSFKVSPYQARDNTDVYVKNEDGEFVKIRYRNQSVYVPYGNLEYMAKHTLDEYDDISESINVNNPSTTVKIEMIKSPPKKYTISFQIINPKHGVTVRAAHIINGIIGEWFETNEFSADEDSFISWEASAVGYTTLYGSHYVSGDCSILIDMNRGTSAFITNHAPTYMKYFLLDKSSSNNIPFEIDNTGYVPALAWGEYELIVKYYDGYDGIKYYKDNIIIPFTHTNGITILPVYDYFERLYGILNLSTNEEYNEIHLRHLTEGGMWVKTELIHPGSMSITTGKYEIYFFPSDNKYQLYKSTEVFEITDTIPTNIDIIFDDEDIRKISKGIQIWPNTTNDISEYNVEIRRDNSPEWITITSEILPEYPIGSTVLVRVSRELFKTKTISIIYTDTMKYWYSIYMEEEMEGGYLYPLYKNDFNTFPQEESTSMLVSPLNKNKELYNQYRNIRFDGTKFGKLPVTETPIVIRFRSKPGGHYPIMINADRRETFMIAPKPSNTFTQVYTTFELNGESMKLPKWEWSNSLYTVYLESSQYHIDVDGSPSLTQVSKSSYILSHTNSTGLRLYTSSLRQTISNIITVKVKRYDDFETFFAKTLPSTIYKYSNNKQLNVKSTWRDNGFWKIKIPSINSLNGDIYFELENTGNIISEQVNLPTSSRWMKYTNSSNWNVFEDGYVYMLRHDDPYASSIRVKYIYCEQGVQPYLGYIDIPTIKYPTDSSEWVHPEAACTLEITSSMIQESLLEFQRNIINDPVTITFGIDSAGDSIEKYQRYILTDVGGGNNNLYYEDVTGLTLQFERGDQIFVSIRGLIYPGSFRVILDKDHTDFKSYDIYKDDLRYPDQYEKGLTCAHGLLSLCESETNPVKIKFNISKYNPNNPNSPYQNLTLHEFDEIIVMANTSCRSVIYDNKYKYFIYQVYPYDSNTLRFQQNSIIRDYTITFRKRGYNTILQPLSIYLADRNIDSKPVEVSLPTLHPVTE